MSKAPVTFETLLAAHPWRPIRGCPGRYSLASTLSPEELLGLDEALEALTPPFGHPSPRVHEGPGERVLRHPSPRGEGSRRRGEGPADPVIVAAIEGGGLISYRKGDGWFVHTLNTPEGFSRKLAQLGLGPER